MNIFENESHFKMFLGVAAIQLNLSKFYEYRLVLFGMKSTQRLDLQKSNFELACYLLFWVK